MPKVRVYFVLCLRFDRWFSTNLKAAILNPYAFSLAIKRSCERQSNAFYRSVRSAPNRWDVTRKEEKAYSMPYSSYRIYIVRYSYTATHNLFNQICYFLLLETKGFEHVGFVTMNSNYTQGPHT